MKFISFSGVMDADTGSIINEIERPLELPKSFKFPEDFCKIHGIAKTFMSISDLGKFVKITDYIEYGTNRIVESSVGKKPIPLLQKDISIKLEISTRSVNTFLKRMKSINAIFKMDGAYYVNPAFASRSSAIESETIEKMLEVDSSIISKIDKGQRKILQKFIRARNSIDQS